MIRALLLMVALACGSALAETCATTYIDLGNGWYIQLTDARYPAYLGIPNAFVAIESNKHPASGKVNYDDDTIAIGRTWVREENGVIVYDRGIKETRHFPNSNVIDVIFDYPEIPTEERRTSGLMLPT